MEIRIAVNNVLTVAKSIVHLTVQITTRAGSVRIRTFRAVVPQDEVENMLIGDDLIECLGIDPHVILVARLEDGTVEAEIDATKMDEKSAQRQSLSKIGTSYKENDAGEEEMNSAVT